MTDLTFSIRCPRFVRKLIADVVRDELTAGYDYAALPFFRAIRQSESRLTELATSIGVGGVDRRSAATETTTTAVSALGQVYGSCDGIDLTNRAPQGRAQAMRPTGRGEHTGSAHAADLSGRLELVQQHSGQPRITDDGHRQDRSRQEVGELESSRSREGSRGKKASESSTIASPSVVGCGDLTVGEGAVAGVEHTAPATNADDTAGGVV